MGRKDGDRLAALDEQGFVAVHRGQGVQDGVETGPVACGLAATAIDNEIVWIPGHFGVEVVL